MPEDRFDSPLQVGHERGVGWQGRRSRDRPLKGPNPVQGRSHDRRPQPGPSALGTGRGGPMMRTWTGTAPARRAGAQGSRRRERDECLKLLGTQTIGRLAVPDHGNYPPHIVPVNFALDEDRIVFRSNAGLKFKLAILAEHSVAFEVDSIDRQGRMAWSVVVQGRAELLNREEVKASDYESCSRGPRRPAAVGSDRPLHDHRSEAPRRAEFPGDARGPVVGTFGGNFGPGPRPSGSGALVHERDRNRARSPREPLSELRESPPAAGLGGRRRELPVPEMRNLLAPPGPAVRTGGTPYLPGMQLAEGVLRRLRRTLPVTARAVTAGARACPNRPAALPYVEPC